MVNPDAATGTMARKPRRRQRVTVPARSPGERAGAASGITPVSLHPAPPRLIAPRHPSAGENSHLDSMEGRDWTCLEWRARAPGASVGTFMRVHGRSVWQGLVSGGCKFDNCASVAPGP
jgi:hypothetical protein